MNSYRNLQIKYRSGDNDIDKTGQKKDVVMGSNDSDVALELWLCQRLQE